MSNAKSNIFQMVRKAINLSNCNDTKHIPKNVQNSTIGNYKVITKCNMVYSYLEYFESLNQENNYICAECKRILELEKQKQLEHIFNYSSIKSELYSQLE